MIDALLEQGDDVRVNDTVINYLSIAARLDDMHLAQPAQMMRYRRFGQTERFCEGPNPTKFG
jgi:hypothetical protein